MEVLIKKAKITKSLLLQTRFPRQDELEALKVLGWCIIDGHAFIVCYNENTHLLSKILLNYEIRLGDTEVRLVHPRLASKILTEPDPDKLKRLHRILTRINDIALSEGQFYI